MALVNASGGPFNAETVKNNNGTILNAGNVAGDGPMANNLDVSASTSNEKYPSVKPRTGSASETQDGAGAQAAVSGNPFAYDSSSDQWVMFGNGVTEGLESRDYTGNLDTDATELARQIDHFVSYGSGSAYNILARPSTNLRSGFTRPTGGGTDFTFIDPNTGLALSGVDLSATRKNPGQLRFNLGGRPIKATYWKVDEVEDYGGGFIAVDTDGDGEAEFYIPLASLYPSDGIHEDAFIFEVNTALSGMITNYNVPVYQGPQVYLLNDTSVSPTTFKLPTMKGGYYNCTIDWGDGSEPESFVSTENHAPSGAPSHTYSSAGTYEIKVVGDFRGVAGRYTMRDEFVTSSTVNSYDSNTRLYGTEYGTSNGAFDALKITKIKRWGTKLRLLPDDLSTYGNEHWNSSYDGPSYLGLAGMYLNFDANWWSHLILYYNPRIGTNFVAPYLQAGQSFTTVGGTAINYAKGISRLPVHSEFTLEDNGGSGLGFYNSVGPAYVYGNYPLINHNYFPHGIDSRNLADSISISDLNISGVSPDGSESGVINYDFYRYLAKAQFLPWENSIFYRGDDPKRIAKKVYPNLSDADFLNTDVGIPVSTFALPHDVNSGVSRQNDRDALKLYNEQDPIFTADFMERSRLSHLTDPADNRIDLSGYQMTSKILAGGLTRQTWQDLGNSSYSAGFQNDYLIFGSGFKNTQHMNLSGCKAMVSAFSPESRIYGSPSSYSTNYSLPVSASNLQDLNGLDVSNIEDMNSVFANLRITGTWNGISGWDVSNVSSMQRLFAMSHNGTFPNIAAWRPNITETSGVRGMFAGCWAEEPPQIFETWLNAGCVKTGNGAFMSYRYNPTINAPWPLASITGWDVSEFTDMEDMFNNSAVTVEGTNFTYDLSNWDVSNVKTMKRMFQGNDTNYNRTTTFSPNIGNWDVTSCENFTNMFYGQKFNEALNWDLTNCKVFDAFGYVYNSTAIYPTTTLSGITLPASGSRMFYGWYGLNSHTEIASLSTSHVTSLEEWFAIATLGADLSSWDTSNVTNMRYTFNGATAINGAESSIANWNTSNVTNMNACFNNSETFVPHIGNWDVSSVTDFNSCFASITNVSPPITGWDVSSATDMNGMFYNGNINIDISNWNVSNVTDMQSMFMHNSAFNQDLSSWDVSSVTNMTNMFNDADGMAANNSLANWNTINVTAMSAMFKDTLFNGALSGLQTGNVQSMSFMFYNNTAFNQPIESWDTSSVTDMSWMFHNADSFNQDLTNWNVASVTGMEYMFRSNGGFNRDLSGWNPSSLTSTKEMFRDATAFNNDSLANWNTASLTNMQLMFYNATAFNGSLSGMNVENVTSISSFLANASSFNQDLSNWNVSRWKTMDSMFSSATAFNNGGQSGIGNWDTSNVKSFRSMFQNAVSFNQPIGMWDTSNATNMNGMFRQTSSFDQDISDWDISSVTDFDWMFYQNNGFTNGGQPLYKPNGWSFSHAPVARLTFYSATGIPCSIKTDFLKLISDSAQAMKDANRTQYYIKGINSCGAEADALRLNLVASGFSFIDA